MANSAITINTNDPNAVKKTGAQSVAGVKTFTDDPIVPAETYGAGWNGSNEVPTKNDVYDKMETIGGGAWAIIETQEPTNSASVTFNTNLGSYSMYKLYITSVASGTGDQVYIKFNDSSTNNRWTGYTVNNNGTIATSNSTSDASGIKVCGEQKYNDGLGQFMSGEVTIHTYDKAVVRGHFIITSGDTTVQTTHHFGGSWNSTSAITSIVVTQTGSNMLTGSQVILMGAN